ncbi:hypothetical protein C2S52_009798 [Perilla frutescens var. hirtella]|nr:hypothetical protein C2S52_009798 [Perilla frutescens var. hirtella]
MIFSRCGARGVNIAISRYPRRSSRGVVPQSYFLSVESSASTESGGIFGPYSQHQINLDDLCAKHVSQVEGPQEVATQPHDLNGDSQPPREDDVVSRVKVRQEKSTTNVVPPSDHCLSPSHGLNVTEFARAL